MAEKLQALEAHLDRHKSIKLFRSMATNRLGSGEVRYEQYAHSTRIAVIPDITGLPGLFEAKYLNRMLESLIPPGLEPSSRESFEDVYLTLGFNRFGPWAKPYTGLRMGFFELEEQIGVVQGAEKHIITDSKLKKTEGYVNGVREIVLEEKPLVGLINVRLWPCQAIFEAAHEKGNESWSRAVPASAFVDLI